MSAKTKTHNILVLNCGSSSLKYRLICMPENVCRICGEAERVGVRSEQVSLLTHTVDGVTRTKEGRFNTHIDAFTAALQDCDADMCNDASLGIDATSHRYVHPGGLFDKTTKVNKKSLEKLRKTLGFAPLHNPICFSLIEECYATFPEREHYVVFDTSFHCTIPDVYATYALPREITKKGSYKRVGFHGISHKYVMKEACAFLNCDPSTQRIISCHLGSGGASVCAIKHGKSINSSMGFTPLEGLIMNTRSGNIDIGLLLRVMFRHNLNAEAAETMLNKKSGVLGVYHASSDLRDVVTSIEAEESLIFKMFVARVRKYIGYYSMLLKKADILIFTDTLGVQMPFLRKCICRDLSVFGIRIDTEKNALQQKGIVQINVDDSEAVILVVPTDEESMIANETYRSM